MVFTSILYENTFENLISVLKKYIYIGKYKLLICIMRLNKLQPMCDQKPICVIFITYLININYKLIKYIMYGTPREHVQL